MKNLFNFKSFLKFLSRNKSYTIINVCGLSISLMFVILIAIYTYQELSVDRFQKQADQIYILGNEKISLSAYGIGERLQNQFPEIKEVLTYSSSHVIGEPEMSVEYQDKKIKAKVNFTYPTFFNFFSFDLLQGDKDHVLAHLNSAVISESFARAHFGQTDPIGQTINLTPSISVVITGIMKDISRSVIPYTDILVRMEKITEMSSINKENYDNAANSVVFLLAEKEADIQARADDMVGFLSEFFWVYRDGLHEKVVLLPMSDAYFKDSSIYSALEKGDWKFVLILMSVGILILLFALTNYINLTVAQTGFRAKEVAVRSLLGSSKRDTFFRLMTETVVLTFISLLISLFLVALCAPYASKLLDTKLDVIASLTPLSLILLGLLVIIIGMIGGFLPATIITQTKAIEVVKGTFRYRSKMTFSKFFITFQNGITIAMVVAALVMVLQIDHMVKAPLGYRTNNILDLPLAAGDNDLLVPLTEEIGRLAGVKSVGVVNSTPLGGGNNHTMDVDGRMVAFQFFFYDSTAFKMLGLEVIRDNQLAYGEGYFLSEHALVEMNLPMDSPTFLYYGEPRPIAGVIKDIQTWNINMEKRPTLVQLARPSWINMTSMVIEVGGDPFETYRKIKDVYEEIAKHDFPGKFIDQQIVESFRQQKRTSTIVTLFGAIAILISLLGLLAMSTYFIQQRSREIAVRKVFDSENLQILYRLVKTFLSYVLIAFVIAAPIVWHLMNQWLTNYSYRIKLQPSFFIAGLLFSMFISFVTVFWQSWMAANQNPAESIKAE